MPEARISRLSTRLKGHGGFTLVELLAALTMIAILTGVAVNAGMSVTSTSKNKHAIADLLQIQNKIDEFAFTLDSIPASLADVGAAGMVDPWGNPYRYLPFTGGIALARKDRFLVPLNTLYDLYSAGRDGLSEPPLSAEESQDDILRANDGAFVGLGRDF